VFQQLDDVKEELSIVNYGISVTTMEEVFLKVGQLAEIEYKEEMKEDQEANNDINKLKGQETFSQPTFQLEQISGCGIFLRHLWAILYQRLILSYRDLRSLFCQMICPLLFVLCGLIIADLTTRSKYQPTLLMSVDQWYDPEEYNMMVSLSDEINADDYNATNEVAMDRNDLKVSWNNTMMSYGGNWLDVSFEDNTDAATFHHYNTDEATFHHYNLRAFEDSMYDIRSETPHHYNAFYIPSYLPSASATDRVYLAVNLSAYHALPITYNVFNNLMLRSILEDEMENDDDFDPLIQLSSHPLEQTTTEAAFTGYFAGLIVSMFMTLGLGFLPVGAVYQIVNDRSSLTKHQQLVSGVSCVAYWAGNYVADFVITLPTILVIWIMAEAFDNASFAGENAGRFVFTMIMYSLAILPFTYLVSFLFTRADKAQLVTAALYFFVGLVLSVTAFIVRIGVNPGKLSFKDKGLLEDLLYRIFPTFSMADNMLDLAIFAIFDFDKWKYSEDLDVFSYDMGKNATCLAVEAVLYFCLLLAVEYGLLYRTVVSKWWFKSNEQVLNAVNSINYDDCDSDVKAEVDRVKNLEIVKNSDEDGDKVVIKGLHKIYQPELLSCKSKEDKRTVHAVRGVHLGVSRGEVFGYLGVNGAGKTTTLACLTGERSMTYGEAYINGISIDNQTAIRRFVGYCPQFDALFPLLTAREHLNFYGRIKGLYGDELKSQIDKLLTALSLTKYENRRAGTYSGGNKRKLSVAVAMIGNPPIVFLDEPSTGMDPMARRSMWDFIRSTMNGRCVILTTHSMEECEALCHKLCIMTAGQLRCLGTPQHLKSKFGHGYQMDLEIEKDKHVIEDALRSEFDIKLVEEAGLKLTYEVLLKEQDSMTLGQVFGKMEQFKKQLPIVSYALNQTTLEQVFIRMAGENKESA